MADVSGRMREDGGWITHRRYHKRNRTDEGIWDFWLRRQIFKGSPIEGPFFAAIAGIEKRRLRGDDDARGLAADREHKRETQ
jgi:hypothetical protein